MDRAIAIQEVIEEPIKLAREMDAKPVKDWGQFNPSQGFGSPHLAPLSRIHGSVQVYRKTSNTRGSMA